MGDQESERLTCKLSVSLPFSTPIVGYEVNPIVRVEGLNTQSSIEVPPHALSFIWYCGMISCSVHSLKLATVQCMSCVNLKIPVKESYHCSTNCFLGAWKKHSEHHQQAAKTVTEPRNGDRSGPRKLRSCGSWPDFGISSLLDESSMVVVPEVKEWVKVGSSKTYVPSVDDAGFCLRLVSVAIHCSTGTRLSLTNILLTEPVITSLTRCPRHMVQISSLSKSRTLHPKSQPSNDVTFSVLSYNILSDIYAGRDLYYYCPTWALAWEYRQKNLLQEIDEYGADILCLQEVQSDHFEDFFKPELTKRGYRVLYKNKTDPVYTGTKYIIDGCATFYRHDRFKEIQKYELELDKEASSLVEALGPGKKEAAGIRLSKVALLVRKLEKIAGSEVPLLICGDMNSLPESLRSRDGDLAGLSSSDPYKFLVRDKIDSPHLKKENDPFDVYQLLNLQHSLSLKSAYASLSVSKLVGEQQLRDINHNNREHLFTNFTPRFSGTLDYILYTDNSLEVESLLELLESKSVGVGLPSPLWSSDHIALMASFRLKPSGT